MENPRVHLVVAPNPCTTIEIDRAENGQDTGQNLSALLLMTLTASPRYTANIHIHFGGIVQFISLGRARRLHPQRP